MSAESSFEQLMGSGILTPAQWYAGKRQEDPRLDGTKQLMLAVLVDALQCFQAADRRLAAEAEVWIVDRNDQGPFAFEIICETLGIDPDWFRENLGEWREQRLSGNSTRRQIRRSPNARRGPIRSHVRRRRNAKENHLAGQLDYCDCDRDHTQ
jgi:hypothetical protein